MTRDESGIDAMVADEVWDAGDMGCGELVLELRTRLARLKPGQVLELIARDPGAPTDLPAWSRLTGHPLVAARHPVYHIRRKETKAGGTMYVCSPCFKRRKLDENKLVAGSTIVGGAKLVEVLSDGSPCLSY